MGIKIVTLFDKNPLQGLPRLQALMVVVDGRCGSPLAVLDGASLTALRTGAASGAATDLLARPEAKRAALFGAGVQGRTQLEAVCAVRRIEKAHVFDKDPRCAESFAREMSGPLNIEVEASASPSEAVRDADVVCTTTTSSSPVFADGDLKEGAHINAVGSYQPHVQEIPAETIARALVVVDQREAALAETGDLIIPLERGIIDEAHIRGELGEIAAGTKGGRASDDQVTLFKSVGVAVQDLAAADRALANASKLGLGTSVPLL